MECASLGTFGTSEQAETEARRLANHYGYQLGVTFFPADRSLMEGHSDD
jgi:hypothetical protein